jgi:mannosyltransferase
MPDGSVAPIARVEASPRVASRLWDGSATLAIALASGVALVLGLIRLGAPSLWADESFTARAVQGPFGEMVNGYHWLYYSLTKPWTLVAGTSEAALRLPSVVGAMLACALLVVLAHKLFDRWVALWSGLFLAASPFVVKWSQQARGYTLMLAVSLVAMLLLLRALDRGTRGSWALYGLAFSAVVVWHPVAGVILVPAHALLAYQRRERVVPHGLLAVVVIGAIAVPWAGQIAMRSTGENVAMNWLKFPTSEVAAHALLDVSGAAGLGLVFALGGLWVLGRTGERNLTVWLATWAFTPFAVALLVSTVRPIFLDRYLLVASPAFALLAGVAVMGVGRRLRVVLVVAALVATTIGLVQWYSAGERGNWRGEDWRHAVQTVLERGNEADAVVVVPWAAASAGEYYGADVVDVSTADSIWVLVWSEAEPRDIEDAERQGLGFGEHRRVEKLDFGRRLSAQLWVREP